MRRPPRIPPIVTGTGQYAAITVKRAGLGAWICGKAAWMVSKFLLVSHVGNRILVVMLALALAWAGEHPAVSTEIVRHTVTQIVRVAAPPVQAAMHTRGRQNGLHALSHRLAHPLTPIGTAAHPCRPPATLIPPPGPCGDTFRTMKQSNDTGSILAPPSTSVQAIWRALWAMGSPLADNNLRFQTSRGTLDPAEYIYDSGLATGVDPSIVVSFCYVESRCGRLGMAALTHSLSNQRPVGMVPQIVGGDGGYAYFSDWFQGIDAIYRLLLDYVHHGLMTVSAAVPVWAPSADANNPASYTAGVLAEMTRLAR